MHSRLRLTTRRGGYSLLEVLVALVVISIGVLGVAAMQATALSGTHSSQTESLVAIQARSLADAMLANSAYWNNPSSAGTITVAPAGTSVTITSSNSLPSPGNCSGAVCSSSQMAAYDLQQWGKSFYSAIPNGSMATVSCNTTSPPVCTILLQWSQKATTAINGASAPASAATTTASYTLINQL
jgi:type IV pilus assembly protein PilV